MNESIYSIALTCTPGIGNITAQKLLEKYGSAEAVFQETPRALNIIFGNKNETIHAIRHKTMLPRCEEEWQFLADNGITALCYQTESYPQRLKNIYDSPTVVYYKGTAKLDAMRVIGIVGTRHATSYGRKIVDELVEKLSEHSICVVSGLAAGIDGFAHTAALTQGLETVGVLGHGLDRIYPAAHRSLAKEMLEKNGGLLTEFMSKTDVARENFPQRNRIIAGLCDALIVVEASYKGGALITANLAVDYNREVFAIPGRWGDPFSEGVNNLVKENKAQLITKPEDILVAMRWAKKTKQKKAPTLFLDLSDDERKIYDIIATPEGKNVDDIGFATGFYASRLAELLLQMEINGIITCYPGKVYKIND